jgi:hypothetical protein
MKVKEINNRIRKAQFSLREALEHKAFSHARIKSWCRSESILVYFKVEDSPSGVYLAGGFPHNQENQAILRMKEIQPNYGPSRGDIAAGMNIRF